MHHTSLHNTRFARPSPTAGRCGAALVALAMLLPSVVAAQEPGGFSPPWAARPQQKADRNWSPVPKQFVDGARSSEPAARQVSSQEPRLAPPPQASPAPLTLDAGLAGSGQIRPLPPVTDSRPAYPQRTFQQDAPPAPQLADPRLMAPLGPVPGPVRVVAVQAPIRPQDSAAPQVEQIPASTTLAPLPSIMAEPTSPSDALIPASGEAWTLQRVMRLAEMYNPILKRAVARIDSARGDALQAGLYPNPRFDTNNPEVFAGPNSSYNVGFMQDIVVKGKLRLNRAAANEAVRKTEFGYIQDRYDMLTAVRKQFYTTLAAQRRVEAREDLVKIAGESLRAVKGREQAGEGTLTEVLLVQTEQQRAESSLTNAQLLLAGELKQLAAIIGLPDLMIDRVAGELTKGFPDFNEQSLRRFVVTQNSQVQQARLDISRNQYLLQRARVEPYPNVRVGPAYNWFPQPVAANGSQQFWFTVQFDIPTWDQNQGNIRSSAADVRDAMASLGVVQNELLAEAADALSRYRAARQLAERIEREILPNARRAQQLVRDGYLKGVLDISTFLEAQRSLTETTVDYYDALEDVWSTAADLANLLQLEQFP